MRKIVGFCVWGVLTLLGALALAVGAELPATDQEALRTQYVNKVLIFRRSYRMLDRLGVKADGTVAGKPRPGYWSMDGACQVKDLEFHKDAVILKCTKLWANVKDDGQLHYFPVSVALKGKTDYPEKMDVVFRTSSDGESAAQVNEQLHKIFLTEQEPKLAATPAPVSAYIQKLSVQLDIDPATSSGFDGTPPKPVSTPTPDLSREALLVGQAGKESFVLLVDEQGKANVLAFTHLLQYGLEETTIEAVKQWRFQPAVRDGKPVPARIAMDIEYKQPPPAR